MRSDVEARRSSFLLRCAALVCCAALSCATAGRPGAPSGAGPAPTRRLAAAEKAAAADPRDLLAQARAGWLRYLVASDPIGALRLLEPVAARADSGGLRVADAEAAALALLAIGEIDEDRLETVGAARAWALALSVAPGSPLAEVAASRLYDAEGDSEAVDAIVRAAARRPTPGLQPRASQWLRNAAARTVRAGGKPGGAAAEMAAQAEAGTLQRYRVAGPFAALRWLDLSVPGPLDGPGEAAAPATGPAGSTGERALDFPDGDVGLELEPERGDLFYAASAVQLARGGDYLLAYEGAAAAEVRLDGAVVLSRAPIPRELPRVQRVPVRLGAGAHTVLVRWTRLEGSRFRLSLVRADGGPGDATTRAPATLRGRRLPGACGALGTPCVAAPAWHDDGGLRAFAERALQADAGDPIAAWLLARIVSLEHRGAASAALDRAVVNSDSGAPARMLRALHALRDSDLPDRVSRPQALEDLQQAVRRDPLLIRGQLALAGLHRDAERYDDAARALDGADAALRGGPATPQPPGLAAPAPAAAPLENRPGTASTALRAVPGRLPARMLLSRARLLEAQGNAAAARARIEAAFAQDPGRCDSRLELMALAQRDGSAAEVARLSEQLTGCADAAPALVVAAQRRGDLARVEVLTRALAEARPAQPSRWEALGRVLYGRKNGPAALAALEHAVSLSPRSAEPLRWLASLRESLGDLPGAQQARQEALRRSPGDLRLRQLVAHDAHQELLGWAKRDGAALVQQEGPRPRQAGAPAVQLLDHSAVQLFADGGAAERVHSVVRVLDARGIARFGEARIPPDAEVLQLRTLKADGRVLEPESIPEKEGVSLHGLERGDVVDIEYLRGLAPRGPEVPGIALDPFFFREEEIPLRESTYEVRAPVGLNVELDQHRIEAPPPETTAGERRWKLSRRDVPGDQPEPNRPEEREVGPWVQVGAGAGMPELIRSLADRALLQARPSRATDDLARAAGGANPRDKVLRIHAAVAAAVRGRAPSGDFSSSAAQVLALARGNRLVVLKGAFASAGIGSHLALVRPFSLDPSPQRFPTFEQFSLPLLRVDLPDGALWIDPASRLLAPGVLPPQARGQLAWVLPERGERPVQVQVPGDARAQGQTGAPQDDGRDVSASFQVGADGSGVGTLRDQYFGTDGAGLKETLERLDPGQRQQGVESMLAHGLASVALDSIAVEGEGVVGGPATLVYKVHAQVARETGAGLGLPASLFPDLLARRWAQRPARTLPLLIETPERHHTRAEFTLPPGASLAAAARPPIRLRTPFGSYDWSLRESAGKVVIEEELTLRMQRVPPGSYADFVAFARAIDDVQARDLPLAKPAAH